MYGMTPGFMGKSGQLLPYGVTVWREGVIWTIRTVFSVLSWATSLMKSVAIDKRFSTRF